MSLVIGNTASHLPDLSKRNFLRGSAATSVILMTGCASMHTIETMESIEKRLQKKFAGMPLVFGSKSNSIPDNIKVTASKNKKGIYVLELPFLGSISEQDFEINEIGDIESEIVTIKFAQLDAMATILASRFNLKEGEKYRVTIEGGTVHIKLL